MIHAALAQMSSASCRSSVLAMLGRPAVAEGAWTLAIITGAVALLLSLVLTPVARRLSLAVGMTDAPGGRRIHLRPIPRGGGVAVAMAAVVACAVHAGLPTGVSTFASGVERSCWLSALPTTSSHCARTRSS